MIRFSQVSKSYPGTQDALKEVDFSVEKNELLFLTGHSGAGKSTLLKLIALLERPTRGQIIINGQNLNAIKGQQIPYYRRRVGVIFQNHKLLLDRTVFDNVALPLVLSGMRHQEIKRRVSAALDKVDLLKKSVASPLTLSGGEQQRVGIARAVVNKPEILLADEPTGNLDPELSIRLFQLFERFNEVGMTTLIATHDLSLIARFNHKVMSLDSGQLIA